MWPTVLIRLGPVFLAVWAKRRNTTGAVAAA
jgi:hypothetical protein